MNQTTTLILSGRLSYVINIVLAAIFGYSIMQLSFSFNTISSTINMQFLGQKIHLHKNVKNPLFSKPAVDISTLLVSNLFGNSHFDLQIATQNKKNHPKTKLNLKLHGIYYSSNSHTSRAMITPSNGKGEAFSIGESLPSGALLHEIYPKKVILLRNGRYETLRLVGTVSINNKTKEQFVNRGQKARRDNPTKLLGDYQRQLQTNPSRLMKLVQIYPVTKGNRFIGYRLKPGKDTTLLSQFDLQSGDILTGVNGVKLNSPLKGLGVIQQLATAEQIDLEVLRSGRIVSLSFAVEK
jgi:general secretion pathway protein C